MTDSDGAGECPICGTAIAAIEVRGPTRAERYAQPCGHQLPPGFDIEGEAVDDGDEEHLAEWRERLAARAGDGGGCLETASAATDEREASRRGLLSGLATTTLAGGLLGGSIAGALPAENGDDEDAENVEIDELPASIQIRAREDGEGSYVVRSDSSDDDDDDEGDAAGEETIVGYVGDAVSPAQTGPGRPTVTGYYCTGSVDLSCAEARAEEFGLGACGACTIDPSRGSCVICIGWAALNGPLGRGACCSGRWERI